MRRGLPFLLVVAAIAVALSVPADRLTREAVACPEVNAYLESGSLAVGQYVTYNVKVLENMNRECGGVTLTTEYEFVVGDNCGDTTPPIAVNLTGNNLSGSYRVTSVSLPCVTLCACP